MIVLCFIFFSSIAHAQEAVMYVAAKSGLSIREAPGISAKVIDKIPYGTKITASYKYDTAMVNTEEIESYWAKTNYKGKSGYIVSAYLLPLPPPGAKIKTMKEWLAQITTPAGPAFFLKKGSPEEDRFFQLKKQQYKNGCEYHQASYYEAGYDSYFIPQFTLEQGFILLRLIPEFKYVFGSTDVFPKENKKVKNKKELGEGETVIRVEKFPESNMVTKISVEYEDGASYSFEMFELNGQLVVYFGGGV
jgi:uncharacterized protein YgiM (DUF1202 family)